MTAQGIKNAISETIDQFLLDNNVAMNEELIAALNVSLTDAIAETLETVNPTANYPSTPR